MQANSSEKVADGAGRNVMTEGNSAAREAGAPDQSPTRELQAEVKRLRRVCTALGKDLRSAEMDRDDARRGEEIWALRCGVVIGRSPIPDAPADLGRLAAETMWRAAGVQSRARWDDCTQEERQRWAYVEAACCERAKANLPEVANLVAETGALMSERDGARRDADRLRTAIAESERKWKDAEATSYQRGLWAAATAIEAISRPGTPAPGQLPTAHAALAGFYSGLAHAVFTIRALATPTQETPDVTG